MAPRLEAAQGEARHRGAGRTALVVLAPLLSAASPPKNGEHSWARSWDRRSRQGNTSPSQPRPSIPKNMKGSGRGCPCSPSPVVLGILQKDAPALLARTWLKDRLSRHLSQERNPRGWGCAPSLGQPAGQCVKAALHPHHIREEQGLGEVLHSHEECARLQMKQKSELSWNSHSGRKSPGATFAGQRSAQRPPGPSAPSAAEAMQHPGSTQGLDMS